MSARWVNLSFEYCPESATISSYQSRGIDSGSSLMERTLRSRRPLCQWQDILRPRPV